MRKSMYPPPQVVLCVIRPHCRCPPAKRVSRLQPSPQRDVKHISHRSFWHFGPQTPFGLLPSLDSGTQRRVVQRDTVMHYGHVKLVSKFILSYVVDRPGNFMNIAHVSMWGDDPFVIQFSNDHGHAILALQMDTSIHSFK